MKTPFRIWTISPPPRASARTTASVLMLTVATLLLACNLSWAQKAPRLEQKLQRQISATWQQQELADALQRVSSAGEISLWLDRRVDGQQLVTLQLVDVSLRQAIEAIAQPRELGLAQLRQLAYVGPQQAARELSTLTRLARQPLVHAPTKIRRRWLLAEPCGWPKLSEPRALVTSWLETAEVQLVGSEQIPHDLWDEQSLAPTALVDRLVVLLAGFDLTCQISADGTTCEVVPIPRPLKLDRVRPRAKNPRSKRSPSRSSTGKTQQKFTLRLENQPLGRVLDKFAEQLQLDILWELERNELARKQLVSCDVKNAGLDELLRSVLSSAKLQHQRDGKRVTIQVER